MDSKLKAEDPIFGLSHIPFQFKRLQSKYLILEDPWNTILAQ